MSKEGTEIKYDPKPFTLKDFEKIIEVEMKRPHIPQEELLRRNYPAIAKIMSENIDKYLKTNEQKKPI